MYDLIYEKEAKNFLKKLPKIIAVRIHKKIKSTKKNPYYFFIKLESLNYYKLRVGDYRIIAEITQSRIEIIKIGHRKNIYKSFQ